VNWFQRFYEINRKDQRQIILNIEPFQQDRMSAPFQLANFQIVLNAASLELSGLAAN